MTIALGEFFAHSAIAEWGTAKSSPWQPRRYGFCRATVVAAWRAI